MRASVEYEEQGIIVGAVMNSFEAHTPKPYLKPVSSFIPEMNSARNWRFPLVVGVAAWLAPLAGATLLLEVVMTL